MRITILLLLAGAGFAGWLCRVDLIEWVDGITSPPISKPEPDPETYTILSDKLEADRQLLGAAYKEAANNEQRAAILVKARTLLEDTLPRLMRCWLGTPWDFNGTAHEPGGGKVACGYFVSSVLQDAGFNVEWGPLAQQPSQNILGTFLPPQQMKIRVEMDYEQFLSELTRSGAGVYIVGLDSHVAFLVVTNEGKVRFIHSSGASPWCVVDESREEAKVLRSSRYRVSGNITANGEVLRNWILGSSFKTRTL
ncbi:MAG: hypothetical protein GWO24_20890 [Akkermansiaceae bacterium]|nr:hypothetical protein [Akkermansiaceae bacterium]